MTANTGSRAERAVNYVILGVFAASILVPLLALVANALGPANAGGVSLTLPHSLHLGNISKAWTQGHFSRYMLSSVIVSLTATVLVCAFALMAGYALGTMPFRGRELVFYVFLLGIMVPEEAVVVPLYFDLRSVGLTNTYWSLILPQSAGCLSFGIFWMRAFFKTSPPSLREAAMLDGASSWKILTRILLPISRPALLTLAMLTFMWTWNEFLLPLVMVSSESKRTAPLGLSFFRGQHLTEFPLLSAATLIVAAPVVILYLFLNRKFIAGMMAGAIKE